MLFPLASLIHEGRRRKLNPLWTKITGVLFLLFAAVEIYGAPFGFIDSFVLRGLFVAFALALTFLCYTPVFTPAPKNASEGVPLPDVLLSCLSLFLGLWFAMNGKDIVNRWTGVDPLPASSLSAPLLREAFTDSSRP